MYFALLLGAQQNAQTSRASFLTKQSEDQESLSILTDSRINKEQQSYCQKPIHSIQKFKLEL